MWAVQPQSDLPCYSSFTSPEEAIVLSDDSQYTTEKVPVYVPQYDSSYSSFLHFQMLLKNTIF